MRTNFCQDMAFWAHFVPDMGRSDIWAPDMGISDIGAHSAPRGGKNSLARKQLLGRVGQEVQGGEPPPCPRVALSPDLDVAFHKNGYLPPSAPVVGTIGDKFQVLIMPGTCV